MSYQSPSRFQILPPVVKNLLIINGLFLLATFVVKNRWYIDLTDMLGLHYWQAEKFRPYQFITYMFMHGNFWHLFSNMFALWMFGNVLENVWGPRRFLIYYLITGIGAALIHYIIFYFEIKPVLDVVHHYIANPSLDSFEAFFRSEHLKVSSTEIRDLLVEFDRKYRRLYESGDTGSILSASVDFMYAYKAALLNAPVVVGASGSVFGILLAFGMLFPNTLLYVYFAIPIKAKYFVIIYGALELFAGINNNPDDNVAHFAHLGGMLFGFILIKYWNRQRNRFY